MALAYHITHQLENLSHGYITFKIAADADYELPSSITVTNGTLISYDRSTGTVVVEADDLTEVTIECQSSLMTSYEIGFRGMVGSQTSLTRTGEAVGATWAASSGSIVFTGLDITRIFGGYAGSNGESLVWDGVNQKYMDGSNIYSGDVGVKINRFFIKPVYDQNSKLDGFSLFFGNAAPDSTYQDWFHGKDHIWVGCYKARGGGFSNGLQSKQGLTYRSAATANDIIAAYKLNTSTAYSLHEKWYDENAILQVLFMVLFATKQFDDVYPLATYRDDDGDTRATGYMDSYRSSTLFAYEPTGSSGMRGNMFLGIEDFVGWGMELVAGVKLNGVNTCPSMDYANFNYANDYSSDLVLPSTGYITEMQISTSNPGLLVPKDTTGGNDITYFCDYEWIGNSPWYQGATDPFTRFGIFCLLADRASTELNQHWSGRLCGIPL